jgi:hypothetical protein
MTGEPGGDKPAVSTDQGEPAPSIETIANERFARGEAFMARYRTTLEALAKPDSADLEVIRQVELGAEIMDEYGETFSALAKP